MTLPETGSSEIIPPGLPQPGEAAMQHSRKVKDRILYEIRENGPLSFARYMEIALYEPGLGYYSSGNYKLGQSGDFITAPELSELFSECLARQVVDILDILDAPCIIEIGPGSGVMACNILSCLEQQGRLPEHYFLLEVSGELRSRQQQLLQQKVPHLLSMISWLDELPDKPLNAVMLGNEVLDAMPVHRIIRADNNWSELFVTTKNDNFTWIMKPLSESLMDCIEAIAGNAKDSIAEGYTTEINPRIKPWIAALADVIDSGMLLFIDYGYPRHEYYHPQRGSGTLLCHYRHYVHADPFVYPGLQDITTSVDFTALAESACEANMQVAGYTTQAHFLLSCGLEESMQASQQLSEQERYEIARQARILTLPGEMGERFKVMALAKKLELSLRGFQEFDQRARL